MEGGNFLYIAADLGPVLVDTCFCSFLLVKLEVQPSATVPGGKHLIATIASIGLRLSERAREINR